MFQEEMRNIFYDIDKLDRETQIIICEDAFLHCDRWWADKLDCKESWARQKVEMTFEEIMDKIGKGSRFHFINRIGRFGDQKDYLEIGFTTMSSPDYFLWVIVDMKHLKYFEDKYKLEELK